MLVPAFVVIAAACGGNVFDLEVGQCFDDPNSFDEVSDVPIVECVEPHDNEIYEVFDLPDGDYPGIDSVEETSQQACLASFEVFVGSDYATSALDIGYLYPTSETWRSGDREVVCMVYDLSGSKLTSTVRGSGL